jgi:tripartite-type tricarboxylate transporter receptor subunit TctC
MKRSIMAMLLACGWVGAALAQPASQNPAEWPTQTVRLVVPYAAGGSSDTLGRLMAQHLAAAFKQTFVVENRGGGGGTIGSKQVSQTPPTGYALVISGIGSHVIAPVETKTMDPLADFTHIAMLGGPPAVLVVHPSVPANNLKEFIAYAQQLKGGLSWGSSGQGSHAHLIGEMFARQAKFEQTHIGYKGGNPAMADLMGGQIPAAFVTYTSASSAIKAGKVKALALTSSKRLPASPDTLTFQEQGFPELVATTWFSLSGPPGMAPELVNRINAEVRKGLETEAMQKQFLQEGIEAPSWDAPTFQRYMRSEIDRWTPLVKMVAASAPKS